MSDKPERDPMDATANGVDPIQDNPRARRQAHGRMGPERGEDPAAGTADEPVSPGEFQAGDRSELAQALGGPVDISPIRGRRMIERREE
ncbi:hypothetical protein J8J14_14845 [Roseomonas sp. SSH11]|uniref:Uncharacterized protein n=1 Tax=Pararoseomonas baculiformis TaxID=2820812 RepID=A0ABS4AG90_9PROT|nr:hypothetical protein [Pararoseomonas baculiformis]MBP0446053.1 hypothetical protein [Pararoseomonas baculiformis]